MCFTPFNGNTCKTQLYFVEFLFKFLLLFCKTLSWKRSSCSSVMNWWLVLVRHPRVQEEAGWMEGSQAGAENSPLDKQQQVRHPGSSRTLRRSRGPSRAGLCCTAEGRRWSRGGRGGGVGGVGQQHYLITTAASVERERVGGGGRVGSDQSVSSALPLAEPHYNLGPPLTVLQALISLQISLHVIWPAVCSRMGKVLTKMGQKA